MKNNDILTQVGLNAYESIIYRKLLEFGSLGVSEISKHTGFYRPVIYKWLPGLMEKNLVAESQHGKRTVYYAESPGRLEKMVDQLKFDLREALPELLRAYSTTTSKPIIKFFEGPRGVRNTYQDLLATIKKGEVVYRYESPKNYKEYRKYVPDEYRKRILDQTEVDWLIITNEITFKQKKRRLGRSFKMVPAEYDLFVYDITQFIYGNKVAFIDFKNEVTTIIESPTFAQFQRKIFKLLFDKL